MSALWLSTLRTLFFCLAGWTKSGRVVSEWVRAWPNEANDFSTRDTDSGYCATLFYVLRVSCVDDSPSRVCVRALEPVWNERARAHSENLSLWENGWDLHEWQRHLRHLSRRQHFDDSAAMFLWPIPKWDEIRHHCHKFKSPIYNAYARWDGGAGDRGVKEGERETRENLLADLVSIAQH